MLPSRRDVGLGTLARFEPQKGKLFYAGRDSKVLQTFATEQTNLLHLSQTNPRRKLQTRYLETVFKVEQAAYAPPDTDWPAIAGICRAVGGSPLAMLLAAAWVETLGAAEILGEIRGSLDFLETDRRHVDARHRSMRVVFDASFDRLTPEEQQAFARMSVFRGGFTRESAQDVAGASLRARSTLVRQSLLRRDPVSGRYDMHELLRQYAEGRLAERPGDDVLRSADAERRSRDALRSGAARRARAAIDELSVDRSA